MSGTFQSRIFWTVIAGSGLATRVGAYDRWRSGRDAISSADVKLPRKTGTPRLTNRTTELAAKVRVTKMAGVI